MSVLSILKRGRPAKDQANGKEAEPQSDKKVGKQKEEMSTPKYHHVPTHAAVDALLGAPAGWVRDDAQRIRENNRKRTAMDAARPGRVSRPESVSMLSPLHFDMHAGSGASSVSGNGNGNGSRYIYSSGMANSSSGSNLSPRWSQSVSSQSVKRRMSTQGIPTSYSAPDYSSLDAEIYRARMSMIEANDASRTPRGALVAGISPSPSSASVSATPSHASTPSTTPTECSTPSLGPTQTLKSKGVLSFFAPKAS
ncbi:MAG: hypothetical protein STHCBS139747_000430 [Sporothrix thermara]